MGVVDGILNLVGLLLWLRWSLVRAAKTSPPILAGRAFSDQLWADWYAPLGLLVILTGRAFLYWQIGSAIDWVPRLTFGPVVISFRTDFPGRAFIFSALSFAKALAVAWTWLVLLSVVNGRLEQDPWQRHVDWLLGPVVRLPGILKFLLPWLAASAAWLGLELLLHRSGLAPAPAAWPGRLQQAAAIGLTSYLSYKYLVVAAMALYLVNAYVYLGGHSFWNFVALTGGNLIRPLSRLPLRIARIDLSPALAALIVFLAAEFAERRLSALYARLPL